ncbi:hypothetical protein EVAR_64323_1 [Eumeta japonica]|uniref:Uncharacterized protein n=1 Tax=Eumeta variegata TaxID=151549 RepID=A0A4C1ZD15_EUMVA|nr:hypothetical protein EVAR_64323_1 [Eumeta japonica]
MEATLAPSRAHSRVISRIRDDAFLPLESNLYHNDLVYDIKSSDRVDGIGLIYESELNDKYENRKSFGPAQETVALHTGLTDEGRGRTVAYLLCSAERVQLERLIVMSVYSSPNSSNKLFESIMDRALCKIND